MRIKQIRKDTKALRDFIKSEWSKLDIKHFGRKIDRKTEWKREEYILVVEDKNGTIYGYVKFGSEAGVIFLKELLVRSTKRKAGIGKTLMDKVGEIAKKENVHKIYLETGDDWNAIKFYKILGFRKTTDLPKHFLKRDFIQMTKYLD